MSAGARRMQGRTCRASVRSTPNRRVPFKPARSARAHCKPTHPAGRADSPAVRTCRMQQAQAAPVLPAPQCCAAAAAECPWPHSPHTAARCPVLRPLPTPGWRGTAPFASPPGCGCCCGCAPPPPRPTSAAPVDCGCCCGCAPLTPGPAAPPAAAAAAAAAWQSATRRAEGRGKPSAAFRISRPCHRC